MLYSTTEEMFTRLLPESVEEIRELQATTKRYYDLLKGAKRARITSKAGTDVEMELGKFGTNCSTGVIEEGLGLWAELSRCQEVK